MGEKVKKCRSCGKERETLKHGIDNCMVTGRRKEKLEEVVIGFTGQEELNF